MDKLKRFIDIYIPTESCNLRCHYCYIAQKRKFNNKIANFSQDAKTIRRALSKKRLGGTCLLNLCAGGETLLAPQIIDIIAELLKEGHYVMVVTNGVLSNQIEQLLINSKLNIDKLFFKLSYHYLELKRLNKLNEFFENIEKISNAGASYTLEITPSDELIPFIDEIKKITKDKIGFLPHITIARNDNTKNIERLTELSLDKYRKIWDQFDSELFKFKNEIFQKKRKEFCYAGDWSLYLNLETGDLKQCYCGKIIDNIYINIDEKLKFEAIGKCEIPYCYNGHVFLTLGAIPELESPTYREVRERISIQGKSTLTENMKNFMNQKLKNCNEEYSESLKRKIIINQFFRKNLKRVKNRLVK